MVTGDDIGECMDVLAGLVLVMYVKPLKMPHQANKSCGMRRDYTKERQKIFIIIANNTFLQEN